MKNPRPDGARAARAPGSVRVRGAADRAAALVEYVPAIAGAVPEPHAPSGSGSNVPGHGRLRTARSAHSVPGHGDVICGSAGRLTDPDPGQCVVVDEISLHETVVRRRDRDARGEPRDQIRDALDRCRGARRSDPHHERLRTRERVALTDYAGLGGADTRTGGDRVPRHDDGTLTRAAQVECESVAPPDPVSAYTDPSTAARREQRDETASRRRPPVIREATEYV